MSMCPMCPDSHWPRPEHADRWYTCCYECSRKFLRDGRIGIPVAKYGFDRAEVGWAGRQLILKVVSMRPERAPGPTKTVFWLSERPGCHRVDAARYQYDHDIPDEIYRSVKSDPVSSYAGLFHHDYSYWDHVGDVPDWVYKEIFFERKADGK